MYLLAPVLPRCKGRGTFVSNKLRPSPVFFGLPFWTGFRFPSRKVRFQLWTAPICKSFVSFDSQFAPLLSSVFLASIPKVVFLVHRLSRPQSIFLLFLELFLPAIPGFTFQTRPLYALVTRASLFPGRFKCPIFLNLF